MLRLLNVPEDVISDVLLPYLRAPKIAKITSTCRALRSWRMRSAMWCLVDTTTFAKHAQHDSRLRYLLLSTFVPNAMRRPQPERVRLDIGPEEIPVIFHLMSKWDLSKLRELKVRILPGDQGCLALPYNVTVSSSGVECLHFVDSQINFGDLALSEEIANIAELHGSDTSAAISQCLSLLGSPIKKLDIDCGNGFTGWRRGRYINQISSFQNYVLPQTLTELDICIPHDTQGKKMFQAEMDRIADLPLLRVLKMRGGWFDNVVSLKSASLEIVDVSQLCTHTGFSSIDCPRLQKLYVRGDSKFSGFEIFARQGKQHRRGEIVYEDVELLRYGWEENSGIVDVRCLPPKCRMIIIRY